MWLLMFLGKILEAMLIGKRDSLFTDRMYHSFMYVHPTIWIRALSWKLCLRRSWWKPWSLWFPRSTKICVFKEAGILLKGGIEKFPSKKWLTVYLLRLSPYSQFLLWIWVSPAATSNKRYFWKRKKNAAFRRRWPRSDLHHPSTLREWTTGGK